ncbi:MAG TPA: S41 family peptidase [Clostridia bacterium]|nr:S41 family peptidase [Clostridia bacterium]
MKKFSAKLRNIVCLAIAVMIMLGQPVLGVSIPIDTGGTAQPVTTEAAQPSSAALQDDTTAQYLDGVLDMIDDQYWGKVSDKDLVNNTVGGMFNSLDDYTVYMTDDEKTSFMDTMSGAFGGIGVTLQASGDYILVTNVFVSSPAEKAGVLQGDKIVEANGVNLLKATTDKAASVIKGEVGTTVRLGILRDRYSKTIYKNVVRAVVKVNPVTFEIRNGIGYIRLDMFNENTEEYFKKALTEIDAKKVTKIILDLRDNPGGEVNQAVAVARNFVPRGLITKLDYKSERYDDQEYFSNLEKPKYKLAVLVNENSASASEIVSGAIQDTGAGKLVGTKTFGKAKFQSIIPMLTVDAFKKYKDRGITAVNEYDLMVQGIYPSDDEIAGYVKMTLGCYYTPKGRMIDGAGLTPDVKVDDPKPVAGISLNSVQKLTCTTEPRQNAQGDDIFNAEKLLKMMGYKIAAPDNFLDSGTVSVLKEYQKKAGLKVSGVLDKKTQASLNNNLLKLNAKYDAQYSAAVNLLNQ